MTRMRRAKSALALSTLGVSLICACGKGATFSGSAQKPSSPDAAAQPPVGPAAQDKPRQGEVKVEPGNETRVSRPAVPPTAVKDVTVPSVAPKPPPQDVPMRISRHDEDMATSRNCVVLSVNGGAEVDFGCNRLENFQHDPQRASRTVTIKALPMPHCNVVRIRVLTQTNQGLTQVENRTTANGAQVADRRIWIFKTLGDYKFLLNINDNEDDIPNDVNMTLDGLGSLFFTVENSGLGCKP